MKLRLTVEVEVPSSSSMNCVRDRVSVYFNDDEGVPMDANHPMCADGAWQVVEYLKTEAAGWEVLYDVCDTGH